MKYICAAFLAFTSLNVFSANDFGKISELYVNANTGTVAVKLDGGFPNSTQANECPNAEWAGNSSADPVLKSTLLAAKASKQELKLSISGCDGGWFKLIAVYVK